MSDVSNNLSKIMSATTELKAAIQNLQKIRTEDSSKTHANFKLVLAKSQKCESLLHILETSITQYLTSGFNLQLAKIKSTSRQINSASSHMDCQAMIHGFEHLESLTVDLETCFKEMEARAQHLVQSSVTEETQTQSDPEFTDTDADDYVQKKKTRMRKNKTPLSEKPSSKGSN